MIADFSWMLDPFKVAGFWADVGRDIAYERRKGNVRRLQEHNEAVAFYRSLPPIDYEAYRKQQDSK